MGHLLQREIILENCGPNKMVVDISMLVTTSTRVVNDNFTNFAFIDNNFANFLIFANSSLRLAPTNYIINDSLVDGPLIDDLPNGQSLVNGAFATDPPLNSPPLNELFVNDPLNVSLTLIVCLKNEIISLLHQQLILMSKVLDFSHISMQTSSHLCLHTVELATLYMEMRYFVIFITYLACFLSVVPIKLPSKREKNTFIHIFSQTLPDLPF